MFDCILDICFFKHHIWMQIIVNLARNNLLIYCCLKNKIIVGETEIQKLEKSGRKVAKF